MRAREAIRKQPSTIEADATLQSAADLMNRRAVGALVVEDDGKLVGIVTDRDLVVRGLAHGVASDARVDSVMSTDPVTMDAAADLREALKVFRTHPFRRLPITHDGELIGLLTVDDLLIDLASDLGNLVRPVTAEVIFGHPEPEPPATTG